MPTFSATLRKENRKLVTSGIDTTNIQELVEREWGFVVEFIQSYDLFLFVFRIASKAMISFSMFQIERGST
ncbi:hypothetical protein QQP08_013144 [Theobroma cacao]|nr:hypothetical protein QQP08_013144 [Theobroma cacao]